MVTALQNVMSPASVSEAPGGAWNPITNVSGGTGSNAQGTAVHGAWPVTAGAAPVAWQTKSCPSWCDAVHDDADQIGARLCESRQTVTPLTYEPTLNVSTPTGSGVALDTLNSILVQPFGASPRVDTSRGTGAVTTMSLDEAEQHARQLLALVEQGRSTLAEEYAEVTS
jgi:hypothetical protein